MLIKDLLDKLSGKNPDDELDVKSLEETEPESAPESSPESDQGEEVKEDLVSETVEQPTSEVEEPVVEDAPKEEQASPGTSAQNFLGTIADLEAKIAELENQNSALAAQKAEADAKQRLDVAMSEGWLTPAMLQEDEGKDSVFVDLSKNHPELFERLRLVMAPKALRKPEPMTDAPAAGDGIGELTDDEKFNKISALAAEKNISYAEAAHIFENNNN